MNLQYLELEYIHYLRYVCAQFDDYIMYSPLNILLYGNIKLHIMEKYGDILVDKYDHILLYGNIDVIKYVDRHYDINISVTVINNIIRFGLLDVLKYLTNKSTFTSRITFTNRITFTSNSLNLAILYGHLHILTWLLQYVQPMNDQMSICAKSNRLDMIKLLETYGLKLNDNMMYLAIYNGNYKTIKYLCEHGITNSTFTNTCSHIIGAHKIKIVKYLCDNLILKKRHIQYIMDGAIKYNNVDVIKYLHETQLHS